MSNGWNTVPYSPGTILEAAGRHDAAKARVAVGFFHERCNPKTTVWWGTREDRSDEREDLWSEREMVLN